MNTMYRNNIGDDKTGYRKTQHAIDSKSNGILSSEIVKKDHTSTEFILEQIKADTADADAEAKIQDEFYNLAMKVPTIPWAVGEQNNTNAFLKCLGKAPKALLHVHSTVGLSVENLGNLIDLWNESHDSAGGLMIWHATVTPTNHKEPIQNVLMYKKQYDHMKGKGKASDGCEVKKGWFRENMSDFCMSEPSDVDANWKVFGVIFMRTELLFQDRIFYREYHKRFFLECLEDNISYIELRTGFADFTTWTNQEEIHKGIVFLRQDFSMRDYFFHADPLTGPNPTKPDVEFVELILDARNQAVDQWYKEHICNATLDVKVILTANRRKTMSNMKDTCDKVDAAISMKNGLGEVKYGTAQELIKKTIIGFDFVNKEERTWGLTDELQGIVYGTFTHEDPGNLKSILNDLHGKCRMQLIRFFFHCGESTDIIGDGGSNAVTGPICSRHRIGHGFQMGTHENLNPGKDLYGEYIMNYILNGCESDLDPQGNYPIETQGKGLARNDYITEPVIELCPISNYMLGYVKDLKEHPAISLMEKGILAVICNDDPQLFYSKGLSYDYVMMYIGLIKYFKEKYKDKPDETVNMAKKSAYEYLKLSSFLGYFYKEMSEAYYTVSRSDNGNEIFMVNDAMKAEDEGKKFGNAVDNFKKAWKLFINK